MSEFEFLAVLLSIVFGLALTQLLTGTVRLFYEPSMDDVRLLWSLTITLVLIINWWGFFVWSDTEQWQFELYAFLMAWAAIHYVLAATLYPNQSSAGSEPGRELQVFLAALLVFVAIDGVEAGLRDGLFSPWYFLPMMISWFLAVIVALAVPKRLVQRLVAWYMFISILVFALVARRLFEN